VNPRGRTASVAGLALLLILVVCWAFRDKHEVLYDGKTLSQWFFGKRRDFLHQSREQQADQAFKVAGTNGIAFLIGMLKEPGDSTSYFKLFRMMPRPLQARLRYPISSDDIHMGALLHLNKTPNIPNTIPQELLARLAQAVRQQSNPRVRLRGLTVLFGLTRYERDPVVQLCQNLLDDREFGIQLEAAFTLSEMKIKKKRSIPILLEALQDKEKLVAIRSISWYCYGQLPGRSGPAPPAPTGGLTPADFEKMQRRRVFQALESLAPELDETQEALVTQSKAKHPESVF
jgi:hypothetical protein